MSESILLIRFKISWSWINLSPFFQFGWSLYTFLLTVRSLKIRFNEITKSNKELDRIQWKKWKHKMATIYANSCNHFFLGRKNRIAFHLREIFGWSKNRDAKQPELMKTISFTNGHEEQWQWQCANTVVMNHKNSITLARYVFWDQNHRCLAIALPIFNGCFVEIKMCQKNRKIFFI